MQGSSILRRSLIHLRWVQLFGLLAISLFSVNVSALNFVTGSKCEAVCNDSVAGTVHDDVRCLDNQYSTAPAVLLKNCVTCQLTSTAVDPVTKVTDVQWALFHLRYALANCMFGYPEERVSISSPCQVSCAPLNRAISFGIANSTNATNFSPDLGFCTGGQFDDFTINTCAFCYSFIPQQLILGNFLQALHIACHSAPTVGKVFYPDGTAIFNQSTIAGPTGAVITPSTGLSRTALILAIVLPVVGGISVLALGCCCCWRFYRKHMALKASNDASEKFYGGQPHFPHPQDFSPMSPLPMSPMPMSAVPMTPQTSPPQPYMWPQHPQELQSTSMVPPQMADSKLIQPRGDEIAELPTSKNSPGFAQHQRRPKHGSDEASTPPTSPSEDRSHHNQMDDNTTVISGISDPTSQGNYSQTERTISPPPTFRAQDGFVREQAHGTGWAR